jgi:hypothetical protein
LGPWKPHGSGNSAVVIFNSICLGWYSCNKFDDSDAKKARDEQERSRAVDFVNPVFLTHSFLGSPALSSLLQSIHEPQEQSEVGEEGTRFFGFFALIFGF